MKLTIVVSTGCDLNTTVQLYIELVIVYCLWLNIVNTLDHLTQCIELLILTPYKHLAKYKYSYTYLGFLTVVPYCVVGNSSMDEDSFS